MKKVRVAVLNSHPIQYFAPLYAYLNNDLELEVTALYCSNSSLRGELDLGFNKPVTWDVNLLDGYPYKFIGKQYLKTIPRGFFSLICPEIWSEIRSKNYDVLWLHGYGYLVNIIAFLAAKSCGVPVVMRSETHLFLHRQKWKRLLRDGILRVVYKFMDGFLAIGTANKNYYLSLKISPEKIYDVPYTVDNKRFTTSSTISDEEKNEIKRLHNLPLNTPIVLYASKLIERKHPEDVINAISKLREQGVDLCLVLIGSGAMESKLKSLVVTRNLNKVHFLGFVNQAVLPTLYSVSDIFVLPAESEPWGLVINEVMCAGLPVIVGDKVGCVSDLVRDKLNGFIVKVGDENALVLALKEAFSDNKKLKSMGQKSLEIINLWSYEECRKGLKVALSKFGLL